MTTTHSTRGQIAAAGEQLYQRDLREKLERDHHGKVAVINVDTGEYELGATHLDASQRAAARWPNARLYAVRIGAETMGHIGGRFRQADAP
jgi:hypothetical protein